MAWWSPRSWFRPADSGPTMAAALPGIESPPRAPDLAEFKRQSWDLNSMGGLNLLSLSVVGSEIGPYTAPRDVPWEVIDAMGYDPVVYLGERAVTSVARDAELYYVRHDDPKVRAEAEAWLEPILHDLVAACVSAFCYGVSPFVVSYAREELSTLVDLGTGGGPRKKTWPGHVHPAKVHPIWPGDVRVYMLPSDELQSLVHGEYNYEGRSVDQAGRTLARRAFLPIWDRQWGRLEGMASRRRAYKAWYTSALVSLWHGRYLERSVDVPRIGLAPEGNVNVNGEDVPAKRILTSALMSLKNGSACVIPSARDKESGQPLWAIDRLDLPDRSSVWTDSLGYFDAKKLEACLMPPGIARGEDVLSSAKVADALMRDFVQGVADFAAFEVSKVTEAVYRLNGGKGEPPCVIANDVPQARRKILLEILRATVNATHHTKDGKTYTLGELVHPELLEQLGIRTRPVEEAAHGVAPGAEDGSGPVADAGTVKNEMDAYGVGVRSGAITPQQMDEVHFRQRLGVPGPGEEVETAWSAERTRRPITLVGGGKPGEPTEGQHGTGTGAGNGVTAPSPGQPGRPRDMAGDRETRREDARTDEGEEATGAEGEGEE